MSCRQTQPVVLRRSVWFRHGSATKQLLVCTRSLWNRIRGVCCHISFWHLPFTTVSFVFGQFGESLTNTNLTSRAFAITWTWRHLYKRGWVTWMERASDRRCSIWFPNKIHRSSRNKFAKCRINYFPAQSKGNALYGVWGHLWISIDF